MLRWKDYLKIIKKTIHFNLQSLHSCFLSENWLVLRTTVLTFKYIFIYKKGLNPIFCPTCQCCIKKKTKPNGIQQVKSTLCGLPSFLVNVLQNSTKKWFPGCCCENKFFKFDKYILQNDNFWFWCLLPNSLTHQGFKSWMKCFAWVSFFIVWNENILNQSFSFMQA